jgi:hypothetical protein
MVCRKRFRHGPGSNNSCNNGADDAVHNNRTDFAARLWLLARHHRFLFYNAQENGKKAGSRYRKYEGLLHSVMNGAAITERLVL